MQPIYAKLLPLEIEKLKRKWLIYLVKLCTILDVLLAISQVQFYRKNEVLPRIEAVTGDVLSEKVFLNVSQISRENTCIGVSF